MTNNIIIRVATKNGDDNTYITNRLGYTQAMKNPKITVIFAKEYDSEADAQREIAGF